MSLDAYQKASTSTETTRQTEYRLFSLVTRSLLEAKESGVKDAAFFKALDWNRRMWSTLASDCGVEGNQLPPETRAGIISLSIWVSKYSSQVARTDEDITPLVDINRTIMEGLAMIPGQVDAADEQPSTQPDTQSSGTPAPPGSTTSRSA